MFLTAFEITLGVMCGLFAFTAASIFINEWIIAPLTKRRLHGQTRY